MAIDPVCGMRVEEENSTITSDYNNRTFHFCSEECKEVFETSPEQYAQNAA
ncbi:MAG TPA: YHS domain-containing protein [Clostridia bacterium]|nr:YHS domain-containing protein [Clostridia bacterium]